MMVSTQSAAMQTPSRAQRCPAAGGGGRVLQPPRGSLASRHRCRARAARITAGAPTPQQQNAASLDVSGAVVQPVFRQTPWAEEAAASAAADRAPVRLAFVSESGVCRAPLAAAAFRAALAARAPHLCAQVEAECRATKDYCVGEGPDPLAARVAAEAGWALEPHHAAQLFRESRDIVVFDVVLVVDKFTAADVLREVSVFDTIQTWGKAGYSSKVRRLGEFDAAAAEAAKKSPDAADIEDALYGNVGGEEELEAVRQAAAAIRRACDGFADFLAGVDERHQAQQQQQLDGGGGGGEAAPRLGDSLTAAVREMGDMDWLVPPMLQPR